MAPGFWPWNFKRVYVLVYCNTILWNCYGGALFYPEFPKVKL